MRFLATVVSIAVGTASDIAPEDHSFAFEEIAVDDLGVVPSDECFYDVTIPNLLTNGWTKYAWVSCKILYDTVSIHSSYIYYISH